MKTAIVVPNWNGADFIGPCLQSLLVQTSDPLVIVVDNGSVDESVELIEKGFPGVHLIKLPKNRGFAGGVNAGIKYALEQGADAVALFNNDAVADENWLKELTRELKKNTDVGIVTGKLMRSDKKHIDSTGDYYSTWGIPFPRGRNQVDTGQYEDVEQVFGASGGASLYRSKMFKNVGLFDEKFFAYYEDVDISFRARLAGWEIIYTPKAVAYHDVSATSSRLGDFTRYHSVKNFLMLYTKNMPVKLYWKYLPYFLYQFARTTARSFIDLKPHIWLKSVAVFVSYLPELIDERHQIQNDRAITVAEVESLIYTERPPKIPVIDA
jgi:GT2 family glycosyltransferase